MPIQLSERLLRVKSSPTVALNTKAKELSAQGINVLSFAVGEPDYPTPPSIVEVGINALKAGKTKYGPPGGGPELRNLLVEKLKKENNIHTSAEQIVCGIGAKEILFHIFLTLMNTDDEVLVPAPYWVSYPDQIIAAGGKPVVLPMRENIKGSSPLDIDAIEKQMHNPKVKGIVLNMPNNPSGYILTDAENERLGKILRQTNWWIISDEIYEYMAFDLPHTSLLAKFPDLADRFFYVNGMSKSFAMTGWRVGYVVAPKPAAKIIRDLQSHSSTCIPPFIEAAAAYAVSQGPKLLASDIARLKTRRDLAVQMLSGVPGIKFIHPQGAFYILVDARPALAKTTVLKEKTDFGLSEYLLMEHHIALVPGDPFGAPGHLRFSYATHEDTIKTGLTRFKTGMSQL